MAGTPTGMFGATPEDVMAAQQAQARAQDMEVANMKNPGVFYAAQAGRGIGDAIGMMSGQENQQLKKAKLLQEAQKETELMGIDFSSKPEDYLQAAAANLQKRGLINEAAAMVAKKDAIAKERATTYKTNAEADKAMRGVKDVDTDKYTAESVAKYAKTGNYADLVSNDLYEPPVEKTINGKTYITQKNKQTGKEEIKFAPAGTTVNNINKQESAFAKTLGEGQAKEYLEAKGSARAADEALNVVGRLRRIQDAGVFSGTFANNIKGAANFLNSMGFRVATKNLANSQAFQATTRELVLAKVKALGSGTAISDADRKFVEDTVPQLETSPEARLALMDFIEEKANEAKSRFADAQKAVTNKKADSMPEITNAGVTAPTKPTATRPSLDSFRR